MQECYRGPVRDGSYGSSPEMDGSVLRCGYCGVERLQELCCRPDRIYEDAEYRQLLGEPAGSEGFYALHDRLEIRNLNALWPLSLRDKTVADIGCAAGSFLDHVSGLAGHSIAIEPCRIYHETLAKRGYPVYPLIENALNDYDGSVDLAFAFSVIEHTADPVAFLREAGCLLKADGVIVVSTPNRRDILMDLLPDSYPQFFYRTVHRWYFDVDSIQFCMQRAGFSVIEVKCMHRFGISNTLAWLRDRKPSGEITLPHMTPLLDSAWKSYLEDRQLGDTIYLVARSNG